MKKINKLLALALIAAMIMMTALPAIAEDEGDEINVIETITVQEAGNESGEVPEQEAEIRENEPSGPARQESEAQQPEEPKEAVKAEDAEEAPGDEAEEVEEQQEGPVEEKPVEEEAEEEGELFIPPLPFTPSYDFDDGEAEENGSLEDRFEPFEFSDEINGGIPEDFRFEHAPDMDDIVKKILSDENPSDDEYYIVQVKEAVIDGISYYIISQVLPTAGVLKTASRIAEDDSLSVNAKCAKMSAAAIAAFLGGACPGPVGYFVNELGQKMVDYMIEEGYFKDEEPQDEWDEYAMKVKIGLIEEAAETFDRLNKKVTNATNTFLDALDKMFIEPWRAIFG